MSGRLIDFLLRLAPRERVLLGLLVIVLLVVGIGYGAVWPLAEERRAAREELLQSLAVDAWVLERRDELAGLDQAASTVEIQDPVGASAVEQGLINRQLRSSLSRLETRDGGEIAMRFDVVPFTQFMRWLDTEHPVWGYRIEQLRIERTDRPSMVEARLTLVPAR